MRKDASIARKTVAHDPVSRDRGRIGQAVRSRFFPRWGKEGVQRRKTKK